MDARIKAGGSPNVCARHKTTEPGHQTQPWRPGEAARGFTMLSYDGRVIHRVVLVFVTVLKYLITRRFEVATTSETVQASDVHISKHQIIALTY